MMTLHVKLSRVAKDLRTWYRSLVPHIKLTMVVCREVVLQLETAHESRSLLPVEAKFIQKLKSRILGLVAVEKNRARKKIHNYLAKKRGCQYKVFSSHGKSKEAKKSYPCSSGWRLYGSQPDYKTGSGLLLFLEPYWDSCT
jgi:hypothetical protein